MYIRPAGGALLPEAMRPRPAPGLLGPASARRVPACGPSKFYELFFFHVSYTHVW